MNLVCLPRLVLGRGVKDPLHSSAATRVRPGVLSVFSFSPDENFFLLLVGAVDFAIFGVCLCGRLRECQENVSICSVKESTHQIMKGKRAGSKTKSLLLYIPISALWRLYVKYKSQKSNKFEDSESIM